MPLAKGGQDTFPPRRQVEIVWRWLRGEDLELLSRPRGDRGRALPGAGPIPHRGKRPQDGRDLEILRRRQSPLPLVDALRCRAGFPCEIGY